MVRRQGNSWRVGLAATPGAPAKEGPLGPPDGRTVPVLMSGPVTCPACRMARKAIGLGAQRRIRAEMTRGALYLTEVDDPARPGKRLMGVYCGQFGRAQIYRLTAGWSADGVVLRAAGMVSMVHEHGRWRLRAIGIAEGFAAHGDVLLDAVSTERQP